AWVLNQNATHGWNRILNKKLNWNDSNGWELTLVDPSRLPGGIAILGSGGTTLVLPCVSDWRTTNLNQWVHVAVVFNVGNTVTLYCNGVQKGSGSIDPVVNNTRPLQIGRTPSELATYWRGILDEIQLYNRALSQAEIQTELTTPVGGTPVTDTSPPTVTITAPTAGTTVFGTVTVSADAADDVGVAGVQFLLDGTPLGVEDTTTPYSILWDTTNVASGNHILTATARDAAGNTATSPMVTVTVRPTTSSDVGQWSGPFAWPIVVVHMTLLSNGKVLMWDGQGYGKDVRLWDPVTNAFSPVTSSDNIFCSGHVALADGKILVAGGHVSGHVGIPGVNLFDPTIQSFTSAAPMSFARWYPTATTLPDGRVLVIAGENGCADCEVPIPEVYDTTTNIWTPLTNASL